MAKTETILSQSHQHNLKYHLRSDDNGNYTGRVLEIPAVIVQGESEYEIDSKIIDAIMDYLQTFESEHKRILEGGKPPNEITESGFGHFVKTKNFVLTCPN